MVPADSLHPPDLINITDRNAVHLISAIIAQDLAIPPHTLTGSMGIRQNEGEDIFLADAARYLRPVTRLAFPAGCFLQLNKRVCPEHAFIRRNSFRIADSYIAFIDPVRSPDTDFTQGIRDSSIPQRIIRKVDLHMADHRTVMPGLLFRIHYDKLFWGELAIGRILIAGDHC